VPVPSRPVANPEEMNPPQNASLYGCPDDCVDHPVWEIRRLLDEHRRGLINVGGISVKLSYQDPRVFLEAEQLGVPLFLLEANKPLPGDKEYGMPQPTGFIGVDQAYLG